MAKRQIYDFEAVWWRGKMVLKGDTIEPQPPFEAYNPFQAYKPYGIGNRGEPRSVLFELLKVNPEDTSQILHFCERFGVLGPSKELAAFDDLAEEEIEDDLPDWSVGAHIKKKFGEIPSDKTPAIQPFALNEFRKAHGDLSLAVRAAKAAADEDRDNARKARENLCRICNYKLRLARPRFNWDAIQNRWRVAWHIGSLEAAIYLMLIFDVQSDGAIVNCPRCGQFFLSEHPRAKFCSSRCLNANKQKKFREKAKLKNISGTGKKPISERKGKQ
jgi:endogenous inhibitor of DNA gyrase (YacG/DUF329 family)